MSIIPDSGIQMSFEEYLAYERTHEERHEFADGRVYRLPGITREHALISSSTGVALRSQLRRTRWTVLYSTVRYYLEAAHRTLYADISVVREDGQAYADTDDLLINPTLVVEVISPASELLDRGAKWHAYQQFDSLQYYLLIASEAPHVELYTRDAQMQWQYRSAYGLDATIALPIIGATLHTATIYEQVAR